VSFAGMGGKEEDAAESAITRCLLDHRCDLRTFRSVLVVWFGE
jgi:hypothetical protein